MADATTSLLLKIEADAAVIKELLTSFKEMGSAARDAAAQTNELGADLKAVASLDALTKVNAGFKNLVSLAMEATRATNALTAANAKLQGDIQRISNAFTNQQAESRRVATELNKLRASSAESAKTITTLSAANDHLQLHAEGAKNSVAFQQAEVRRLTAELGKLRGYLGSASMGLVKLSDAHRQAGSAAATHIQQQQQSRVSTTSLAGVFSSMRTLISGAVAYSFYRVGDAMLDADMKMTRVKNTLLAITGSTAAASQELAFVRETANRLGADFGALAESYGKFSAAISTSGMSAEETRRIFVAFTEASTVMGLSADNVQGIFVALAQMFGKGTVSAEELRQQLGDRLPGAMNLAAQAMKMPMAEFMKAVESGQILASDLIPRLATLVQNEFGSALPSAMNSTQASLNRLSTAWFEFKSSVADSGFAAVVKHFFDAFAQGLTFISDWLKEHREGVRFLFAGIASGGNPATFLQIYGPRKPQGSTRTSAVSGDTAPMSNSAESKRRAEIADLLKRGEKLTETVRRYNDALIESKTETEQILLLQDRIKDIYAEMAKPISFTDIPREKHEAVKMGWTQKQVELDAQLLEANQKIEAARDRQAKVQERIAAAQRAMLPDAERLVVTQTALGKALRDRQAVTNPDKAAEADERILALKKEIQQIEERITAERKRANDELDRTNAQFLQERADARVRQREAELAAIDANPFMTEQQKRARRYAILTKERDALPEEIETTRSSIAQADASGDSSTANFYRQQLKVMQDRQEIGNPSDLMANRPTTWIDDMLTGFRDLEDSFRTVGQSIADVMDGTISSISSGIQGLINGTMNFGQAFWSTVQGISQSVVRVISDMVAEWIVKHTIMAGIRKLFHAQDLAETTATESAKVGIVSGAEVAKTGIVTVGAGARMGAVAAEAATSTSVTVAAAGTQSAATGVAGVFRSIMELGPIAGPLVFASALGGMIALVSKFAKGFAEGGYTGPGGKYEVAGVAHKGEVVFSQRDVARAGGVAAVERMRLSGGLSGRAISPASNGDAAPVVSESASGGSVVNIAQFNTRQDAESWLRTQRGRRVMQDFISGEQYALA